MGIDRLDNTVGNLAKSAEIYIGYHGLIIMELALQTKLNNSMERYGDRNLKCPKWPFFQHIKRKSEYGTHHCDFTIVLISIHPRKYPNPYLIKAYDLHSIMRSTSRKRKRKADHIKQNQTT